MKTRVLSFENYYKIFEEEPAQKPEGTEATNPDDAKEDANVSSTVADSIYNAFVDAYFSIVAGIDGGYSDVVTDLQSISKQTDATKKGEAMANAIAKVAGKLGANYKGEIGGDASSLPDSIKKAYNALVQSEEGKKSLDSINSKIDDSINKYVATLVDAVKKAQVKSVKESEYLSYSGQLFEKNLFPERRNELLSTIVTPRASQFKTIMDTTTDNNYKNAAKTAYDSIMKISAELSTDDAWEKMNRRGRKDRLEAIPGEVEKIQSTMNDATSKFTSQLKIDSEISASLKELQDKVNSIKTKSTEIANKQAQAEATKKAEEAKKAEEPKKEEGDKKDFKEIKSGNIDKQNLKKDGENYKEIKNIQGKLNEILPKDKQIKVDGGYGKNTEDAIKTVARMLSGITGVDLLKDTDEGKILTPDLQKRIENFTDPKVKEEIQKLMSK
jgi:hypothetical protein